MGNWMDSVLKKKLQTEPLLNDTRYVIFLSTVILLLTLVIFWWFSRHRHSRNAVLLIGLSDAGKTLTFLRLVYSEFKQTYTSMKENIEMYTSAKGSLKMIDLPGQERLRNKFFDIHKQNAKAILFVVDSVSVQKEVRDVADFLYDMLSDKVIFKNAPPILIVCNKQDLPMAKCAQVVQALLQKEMNVVRKTKSSQLESVDPNTSNVVTYLGRKNKFFEFSQLNSRIDFCECALVNKDPDAAVQIEEVKAWLDKI